MGCRRSVLHVTPAAARRPREGCRFTRPFSDHRELMPASRLSTNDTATTEIYTLSLHELSDLGGRRIILVIRSGRAAHETTLAGFEGRPGARHGYGEVVCEAIEQLQRDALDKPRPELVVKVDRSGLNEHHPIVGRLYQAIDRLLRPIVAAEEKRAGAHLIGAPRAVSARDQVGLRALNDLLKAAFDQPGSAAAEPGDHPVDRSPAQPSAQR